MAGFHEGELAVQQRAGVRLEAARLSGMVAPGSLSGGAGVFLSRQRFAALTGRDDARRLWTSPLVAAAGFLDGADTSLHVHTAPGAGDPLSGLPAHQPIGMVAIDFATRRRFRVNGELTETRPTSFDVAVDQAFGNCPQYIHPRSFLDTDAPTSPSGTAVTDRLSDRQASLIGAADTMFLGTIHPERGADASHRGGPAGFVRVEDGALWWPDLPGNNMFNSFGNLVVDDEAALLFIDFATGETVQLSGRATVEWVDDDYGRRVTFDIERVAGRVDERLRARQSAP